MNAITQHELSVIDRSGDTKTTWNPRKPDEVAAARAVFDALKAKGHAFFKMNADNEKTGEQIHKFDPEVARMIGISPITPG